MVKIVAISDVHTKFKDIKIEDCDILISAGDYSFHGYDDEVRLFHEWLDKQPATHVVSVQGNHEVYVEADFNKAKSIALKACPRVHFIDEGLITLEGINIFGSAITPYFFNWAWNRFRGEDIKVHWDRIPEETDILVTHGPVYNILDEIVYRPGMSDQDMHVGCADLLNRVKELKQLKLHICGHIHNSYGQENHYGIKFVNASICDEKYQPVNRPIIIEI